LANLHTYLLEDVLKVDDALHLLDEHIRDLAEQDLHLGIPAKVAGHGPDVTQPNHNVGDLEHHHLEALIAAHFLVSRLR